MAKIELSGEIPVAPEEYERLRPLFEEHVALSRAEPGCERFDAAFDPGPPPAIRVSERYRDRDAFEAHRARTAASEWGRASAHLPRHFELREID